MHDQKNVLLFTCFVTCLLFLAFLSLTVTPINNVLFPTKIILLSAYTGGRGFLRCIIKNTLQMGNCQEQITSN